MSSMKSTTKIHEIYPDHPSFRDLDWIRTYEISRACLNFRPSLKLPLVIDPTWNSCNPAELCNFVREVAKSQKLKSPNPVQIEKNLKLELEKCLDDGMEFAELQRKLEFNLIVDMKDDKKMIELSPPKFCKHNTLNRIYGAQRFLVVTLSEKADGPRRKPYVDLFTSPWRIGNRVYHTFLRKDDRIYMVHIEDQSKRAVADFMNEILDISRNKDMSLAKWVSRGALLVSGTSATITFRPENIRRVPDLMSNSLLISPELMNTVADALGLNYLPVYVFDSDFNNISSAIRGNISRLDAQGPDFVWRLGRVSHPNASPLIQLWKEQTQEDQEFKLEEESMGVLRDFCQVIEGRVGKAEIMTDGAAAISRVAASQISSAGGFQPVILPSVYQGRIGLWYLDPNLNPLDTTIWIEIRDTQWKAECRAGFSYHFNLCRYSCRQNMPVLASRGIPIEVFEELVEEAVRRCVDAFETSDPVELVNTLSKEQALTSYRKRTLLTHGGDSQIHHDPTINRTFRQTPYRLQQFSLQPTDRRLSIPLSLSAYVYAMPDPTGTLQKGEAFLQFSAFRDSTGSRHGVLSGPALIWRSPCAAPIDVQKVRLVANEHLQRVYFDVIVCSTLGDKAVLSLLSGGDQVCVTWDKRLVNKFQNANPDDYPEEREEDWFDRNLADTIGNCLLRSYIKDPETFVKKAQLILIEGLCTSSNFASYAMSHGMCDYVLGAEHPLTRTTGWIYVKCLDAAKSGLVLKKVKDIEIRKEYNNELRKQGVPLDQNGKFLIPLYEKCLPRNEKKCMVGYKRPVSINPDTYVLDLVFEAATTAFERYKEGNESYDKATHGRRAQDKDDDLRSFFLHQKRIFDQSRPKPGGSNLTDWGTAGVWHGVLKHMQRAIAKLQGKHKEMAAKIAGEQDNDQALQEEEHYVPASGNNKMILMKPILTEYHLELSWENAYKTSDAQNEFLLDKHAPPISEEEEIAFLQGKEGYLDALGPDGYAILKASCAASISNAEGYFPFDVAFREICYLKAQASVKNYHLHSPLKLAGIEEEYLSPATLDSTTHYASLSKRMFYSKRAARTSEV
ncbi:RNA dependent RNA polymerase-domain-containing protein [Melampsora americana]|nr:RNA dependent RNA polymerase-domain-containing protein [Melampsora americana]